jgi:hypothetical protein
MDLGVRTALVLDEQYLFLSIYVEIYATTLNLYTLHQTSSEDSVK